MSEENIQDLRDKLQSVIGLEQDKEQINYSAKKALIGLLPAGAGTGSA